VVIPSGIYRGSGIDLPGPPASGEGMDFPSMLRGSRYVGKVRLCSCQSSRSGRALGDVPGVGLSPTGWWVTPQSARLTHPTSASKRERAYRVVRLLVPKLELGSRL
jgi:hypothetical protein